MVRLPDPVFSHVIDFLRPRPNPAHCVDTVPELKSICRERGLRVGGNKLTLIKRLLENGCCARRCFWDTAEHAELWGECGGERPPMLTFRAVLHTGEAWESHTSAILSELEAACPGLRAMYNRLGVFERWSSESVRNFPVLSCSLNDLCILLEQHLPLLKQATKKYEKCFNRLNSGYETRRRRLGLRPHGHYTKIYGNKWRKTAVAPHTLLNYSRFVCHV